MACLVAYEVIRQETDGLDRLVGGLAYAHWSGSKTNDLLN